ncbi:MAG: NAD(P)/FAD-dependent oxidoreductase [Patescibacteria group bacterium]
MDYDTAVIGGGPAGIMAAISAVKNNKRVVLIEKNNELGKKLLLTGGGRCNLTHDEFNTTKFLKSYGMNSKFLYSAFNIFGPEETIAFFNELGIKTKTESTGKIFPISNNAHEVRDKLLTELKKHKVEIKLNSVIKNLKEIKAKKIIIATGGKSYPVLGSTGDGYAWAKALGHTIISPQPVLTPIILNDAWLKQLSGLGFDNVKIKVVQNNRNIITSVGELLFTHFGLSGPMILNLSRDISSLKENKNIKLQLDFFPDKELAVLHKDLQELFEKYKQKNIKNILSYLLPEKVILVMLNNISINLETKCQQITKIQRKKIVNSLKSFPLSFKGLGDFSRAMVTRGGVSLKEVDPKTMRSKLDKNIYFAGEVLDIDGETGGYNLQMCWSTGFVAGNSIIN